MKLFLESRPYDILLLMRFFATADSQYFFEKNLYLPMGDILKPEQKEGLFEAVSASSAYNGGRDNERVRKICFYSDFAQLVHVVTRSPSVRFAFSLSTLPKNLEATLRELSSATPIVGALLISTAGVLLLHPEWSFNLLSQEGPFLLIVYSSGEAIYTLNPKDPNTHAFKKEGFAFGDRLRGDSHPLLFS